MLQKISGDQLKQWRKIIGMRNALVHDYLNIDSELLQQLLAEKRYQFLIDFLDESCREIQKMKKFPAKNYENGVIAE